MKIKKNREANLELLRIIAMLLIILLHAMEYSDIFLVLQKNALNCYLTYFLYGIAQIAVNCYVLISGYFLINSQFRLKKLVLLWMEVVFYALFIYLILVALGMTTFGVGTMVTCLIPILSGRYWFVTIYVGMYLLSPFLNKAIGALSKEQHRILNIILFFLFSVWIILPFSAGMNSGGGWGLAWFIVLYFQAAYLRLYYKPNGPISKKALASLIGVAMIFLSKLFMEFLGTISGIGYFSEHADWCYRYDSLPVFLASVSVFILFLNIRINSLKLKKVIFSVSPLTFAVYLIHHHARLYPIIWGYLNLDEWTERNIYIPYLLLCVLLVFLCSAVVAKMGSITLKLLEKAGAADRISCFIKRISENICFAINSIWKWFYGESE